MKNIYKDQLPETTRRVVHKIEQVQKSTEIPLLIKFGLPEVQKVKIENPPIPEKIQFPEVQKVEVTNPQIPLVFPKEQAVRVVNPTPVPKPTSLANVERLLLEIANKQYPQTKEVSVNNFPNPQILPIYEGNKAGKADPSRYLNVRLTNGEHYYNALADAFVAAGQKSFPFKNYLTGQRQSAAVDNAGNILTNVTVEGITVTVSGTTTSGTPGFNSIINFPTVQTVNVKNSPDTISGMAHAFIDNIPTIQSIYGQVVGDVASEQIDSSNPVKVGMARRVTLPSYADGTRAAMHSDENGLLLIRHGVPLTLSGMTTISGGTQVTQHVFVDNYPTIQTVNVQNMPKTTISGAVGITDGNAVVNILKSDGTSTGQNAQFVTDARSSLGSVQASVATAGTAVQFASHPCTSVTIKAKSTNTGFIYIGASGVSSSTGFILSAGDSVSLDILNTNLIYMNSTVNGEGVSYIYIL